MPNCVYRRFVLAIAFVGMAGCSEFPLGRFQPASSSGPATCPAVENIVNIIAGTPAPGALAAAAPVKAFTFVLPNGSRLVSRDGDTPSALGAVAPSIERVATFDDFVAASQAKLANLPPEIRNHSVTDAIFRAVVKTSGQAQLNRANVSSSGLGAAPVAGASEQQAAVNSFRVPTTISTSQLKDFADKFTDKQLQPTITAPDALGAGPDPFSEYFTAYYQGNFIDRFGQPVSKPSLSLTVPDAQIAAALTVLVEYTIDLLDPTPVLGDRDIDPNTQKFPADTKFYPGKSAKQPTALVANLAKYKNISSNKCGVTTDNASILADVANAAGDRAATIGGLVSQSWGGISIGLGVLGKFSIGDNQTLGIVVKTVAARLGTRISYAASYWALDSVGQAPALGAAPFGGLSATPQESLPRAYLKFH